MIRSSENGCPYRVRLCDANDEMRGAKTVRYAFEVTYASLLDILESHPVHRVPLEGKSYNEVEYDGISIPQPWEVVGKKDEDKDRGEKPEQDGKVVHEVLIGLWVESVKGGLRVVRRGKVMY